MRKIFIAGLLLLSIVSVLGIVFFNGQSSKEEAGASNEEFVQAITSKYPVLLNDGKPVIKVDSVVEYDDGWHVVTIRSVREVKNFVPVTFVILSSGPDMEIILGPDTHFTQANMLDHNLPDSIIMDLRKS